MHKFLLALPFLLGSLASLSIPAHADKIDDFVRAEMARRQIPGLALAVVQNGKTIKLAGYGLADLENDVPVTPDTVFDLASLSKTFTASAIMLLVQDGKLSLDAPIVDYLPNPPANWQGITVRHLLSHTAGLPDADHEFASLDWTVFISKDAMYQAAIKDLPAAKPGEKWEYSDEGYFLLGMILEKVSGQSYSDFLSQRLFQPLGMDSTRVYDPTQIVKHLARGYGLRGGQPINIRRVTRFELFPQGGVVSSAADLVKWDTALREAKLLKPATLEQMTTPAHLNDGGEVKSWIGSYGYGWHLGELNGHPFTTHPGITGVEMTRFPHDKLTVIALTNLGFAFLPDAQMPDSWGLTMAVAKLVEPGLK